MNVSKRAKLKLQLAGLCCEGATTQLHTLLAIFIKNELVIHNDAFFYPVKKNNDNSFKE